MIPHRKTLMTEAEKDRGENGRFIPGTAIWRERNSHGRNPVFESPEDLWKACCEYFEWANSNPLYSDTLVTFQGKAEHEPVAHLRAFTLKALCLHVGIKYETWRAWRNTRLDLKDVMTDAENVIHVQKFEGAAAGLLNSALISRDLGLVEKREIEDTTPPEHRRRDDSDVARAILAVLARGLGKENQQKGKGDNGL